MNLLRGDGPALRIGHRGASALAPANTIQAVEAALAQGVDLVELDVFGRPDRTLVLGHSRKELGEEPVTIEDVFAFLTETAPGVGLLADLKGAGWEQQFAGTGLGPADQARFATCFRQADPEVNAADLGT